MTPVLYKNEMWYSDQSADMLQLKMETYPNHQLIIHKQKKTEKVRYNEIVLWSIARNEQALGGNNGHK